MSPLEYWFLKLHAGRLAFLVDFIVRRRTGRAEVRVSLWVDGRGRVARVYSDSFHTQPEVAVGDNLFSMTRSVGAVEDVEWDLRYEAGPERIAPRVPGLSRLRPFDLDLVSWPRATFSGHVVVAGERFAVDAAPGCLTHYWGRRLARRWHWISADGVEAVVLRSGLWGTWPRVPIGYVWTAGDGLLISPLNGLITVRGTLTDYTLVARRPGRTVRLRCSAAPGDYNDLGEGIQQTLLGRCTIVDSGRTDSLAGMEYRVAP